MIALVLLVVIIGVLVFVDHRRQAENRKRREVTRRLQQADQRMQREYTKARQQMNDAAGQSWRNIIDGDRG